MFQTPLSHCDCCGLPIRPQIGEDCPRCHYPIDVAREERFLETALRDLQRVADYGGVNLTVGDLINRYQLRLSYLRQLRPGVVLVQPATLPESRQPGAALTSPSPPVLLPSIPVPSPLQPAGLAPLNSPVAPVVSSTPAAPVQERQKAPRLVFSFSWRSFFIDQAITIIGLLGAFLILMGALSSVITTGNNRLLSFLIVFGVHAFFGVAGLIAYRFANFRLIARIYTGIYALLIPLVGFTGYSLIQGSSVQLSVPTLIAIAAAYAAIVYVLLAVYQRFAIFGYLGAMALIVADLAIVQDLPLAYWWWPDMLMLLALPALASIIPTASGRARFFTGSLVVLRDPVRIFMYIIVGVCVLGIVLTTWFSLLYASFSSPLSEVRFSILSMTVLLLLWTGLALWLTKRTKDLPVLALMFLACVLAGCYAFNFSQGGYALALVGTALFYHGLNRFSARLLQPFDKLGLRLVQIALLLVIVVPFVASILLPLQLLLKAYQVTLPGNSPFTVQANLNTLAELIAVGVSCLITISIALYRTSLPGRPGSQRTYWPWLLLLSGFLLNWAYSVIVLLSNIVPAWSFMGLTVALIITAIIVRRLFGAGWANPLDVLVLGEMLLTLSLSLNLSPTARSALLLFFAAFSYSVLLYQRRQNVLFLPFIFALAALPDLASSSTGVMNHAPTTLLLVGLALPLASVGIRRLMSSRLQLASSSRGVMHHAPTTVPVKRDTVWVWPLLTFGLLCGIVVSVYDVIFSTSAVQSWLSVTFPVALEMSALALVWYASAALVRVKRWLIPVVGFAGGALLLPTNPFWVLVGVTSVAAVLAFAVSRLAGRTWALPLYIVALLGAVMTGMAGYQSQSHLVAASWILLTFGLLAYILGLEEDLEACLWLLPAFATWSLLDAAQVGDLYRPPTIALIFAAMGVAIGCLNKLPFTLPGSGRRNSFLGYTLPFYVTAFAAAVLTGVYGMLPGAKPPFYGAIPDALLIYALVAFGVLLFERQPKWLWLVAGFATWSTLLATSESIYYVTGIGLGVGIVGLLVGRSIKQHAVNIAWTSTPPTFLQFSWGWPWYMTALVAAVVIGFWPSLFEAQPAVVNFIEYSLLAFAVLFYLVGIAEDQVPILWVGSLFAAWSLIDSASKNDFYRLLTITLAYTTLGLVTSSLKFFTGIFKMLRSKALLYSALPFYVTALIAAVLSGYDITAFGISHLFYSLVPDAVPLLVYAGIAYGVLLFERQPGWLGLVAGFGIWGTLLAQRINVNWVISIGIGTALLGLLVGRLIKQPGSCTQVPASVQPLVKFTWGWPWYMIALVAVLVTGALASRPVDGWALLVFAALAYIIMLVERTPEILILPAGLAAWAIWQWQPHLAIVPLVVAYSLLCVLIFASQFVWKVLPPATLWLPATLLHRILAVGGQLLIVLVIIGNGGLFANAGTQAFAGGGALFVLALLIFWYGRVQDNMVVQRCCDYGAGLLVSLVVSWALAAFHQTNLDLLMLAPATYLAVIAPLLLRDEALPEHYRIGQAAAVLGATLLLLPTLWLSFMNSDSDLLYTLILMGEALVLFLLGIGAGVRVFILTGAGLIVVGALHALFLPSLGIPTPLALTMLGTSLLAVATGLSLLRRRLQSAWAHWE